MRIFSIFKSISGELGEIYPGQWCIFVRLAQCNLSCQYCFGVVPGRRVPHITTSVGMTKHIMDVQVGDKLLTFDENKNLVETEVVRTLTRKVTKWFRLKIEGTYYYVTPEHPFFTTKGLVKVSDLKVGDVILHATPNDKHSFSKKGNRNPMKRPEVAKKSAMNTDYQRVGKFISKAIQHKKEQGTYTPMWNLLDENKKELMRKKISIANKGENNGNWKGGPIHPNYEALKKYLKDKILPCDICGEVRKLEVHHIDGNHNNDDSSNFEKRCHSCHSKKHERGYNFWKSPRSDGKQLHIQNGMTVESIKFFDRDSYPPSTKPKPLEVYNLTCSPHNSYLVDYMWVHNCDTKYANTAGSGKDMTVSGVIEKIKDLQPLDSSLDSPLPVLITGGEPLLQMPEVTSLVEKLREVGLHTSIETNGSIIPSRRLINQFPFMIFDYKLPSSGMEEEMVDFNEIPRECSHHAMIKFVCSDIHDYQRAKEIIERIPRSKGYQYAISPALSPDHDFILNPDALYKWMLRDNLTNVMISTQLHKILNLTEHP